MTLLMATKHRYFFETDYAILPSWSRACLILRNSSKATLLALEVTPEVAPEVTGQVTGHVTGEVAGQVAGEVTGEAGVASTGAMIKGGDHSRLPFLHGLRNLFTANPPSLCSTGSILAGLFLPGLGVSNLRRFTVIQAAVGGNLETLSISFQ